MSRWLLRWTVATVVLLSAVIWLGAEPARAHARLVSTSPISGSVLESSPLEIRVALSEPVDLVDGSLRLVAADGTEVELGPLDHDDPSAIVAVVSSLQPGTYVVGWRAISSDSHPVAGAFSFSIGAASGPASAALLASLATGGDAPGAATTAVGVARWASYLGLALLIGVTAISRWLGLWPAAGPAIAGMHVWRVRRILIAGWILGVAGTAAMVVAQGSILNGGGHWFDIGAWIDAGTTRAGLWWVVRLALLVVGGPAIAVTARRDGPGSRLVVGMWMMATILATSLGGHAVTGRWVAVGFVATVWHLVAMCTWIGLLVVLALAVPRERLAATARRCSPVALSSVVVLAGSGVLNGVRQVGEFDALTSTDFGRLLIAKTVLVVLVLVLAAESRFVVRSTEQSASPGGTSALRRTVPGEFVGVVAVLALTAALVNQPPGRDQVTLPATVTMVHEDRVAQVVVEPAASGVPVVLHVTISSPRGSLDVPDEMTLSAENVDQQLGPIEIALVSGGPNHAVAQNAVFPLDGTWSLEFTARYGEFDQVVFRGELEIG